jgi:uncharacterized protein DUF2760
MRQTWTGGGEFCGIRCAPELYKPNVTASLPWWRRVGLAFGVFFRVLFDGRYAASLSGGGAVPALTPVSTAGGAAGERMTAAAVPADRADGGAVLLLSLLQAEGRFVDFVQQDVAAFSDADVGAVARVVHAGCRKVLGAHVRIEAIRSEPEGQRVALEPGFDPSRIKLTGNVGGGARLNGVLRHRGWQATDVKLPRVLDSGGALVLCPAEVEL